MATMKATKKVTAQQYQDNLNGFISNENKFAAQAAKYNKALEALNAKWKPGLDAIVEEQKIQAAAVQQYCEENRATLYVDTKTIDVNGAKLAFKFGKAKMELAASIEGLDEEQVKELWENALQLVEKKLPDYVREVKEISKAKLIEDRLEAVVEKNLAKCGLKITQPETFSISLPKPKK